LCQNNVFNFFFLANTFISTKQNRILLESSKEYRKSGFPSLKNENNSLENNLSKWMKTNCWSIMQNSSVYQMKKRNRIFSFNSGSKELFRCKFHQHFLHVFFVVTLFWQLFTSYIWPGAKILYERFVRLILMKLTTGVNFINVKHANFSFESLFSSFSLVTFK